MSRGLARGSGGGHAAQHDAGYRGADHRHHGLGQALVVARERRRERERPFRLFALTLCGLIALGTLPIW